MTSPSTPTKLEVWKLAARPKTLPAAVAPVLVGMAVAWKSGGFRLGPALACVLGALLIQIGANIANDYFDYFRGADAGERLGPLRVTQAGLATPAEVRLAMLLVFALAVLVGLYLAWAGGWPVIAIGLASIAAAVAYTGGPFPFGYYGLGELFAFLFFGPVAVCGTVYVQMQAVPALALWASLPLGFLVAALLVVNNLRDIESDRKVGKRTLAVRLGVRATRGEYAILLAAAYLVPLVLSPAYGPWLLLSWGSLALVPDLLRVIFTQSGRPLNLALAGTGRLVLVYGVLLALGMSV
ncbi:MAG: 1,4-dihydroxy-2-naphthoate polyprenyltransferase [Chloroflexota bacterium]